ncbi:hypothetical protein BCEP4_100061 [Burkholderia cepacia]|nr:hypothetical protein BCEP4_100061 [Burkholderia cepacia]
MSCTCSALPYHTLPEKSGAGDESRTRDLNLGKVALYQLSYSRMCPASAALCRTTRCQKKSGAGDESRTRDLNLGKVALYQLSYSRMLLLPRHTLTSSCSGEARLCRRHIRVSRAFPALFPKNLVDRTRDTHHAPPRSRICGHASFM